jgi:hypothetical protein
MIEISNLSYIIAIVLSIVTIYLVSQYNKNSKENYINIPNPSPGIKKVVDKMREINNRLNLLEHKLPLVNSSIVHRHNNIRNRISDRNDRESFKQSYLLAGTSNLNQLAAAGAAAVQAVTALDQSSGSANGN